MPAVGGTRACAIEPAVGGRTIATSVVEEARIDRYSCACASGWPADCLQQGIAWGIDGKVAAGEGEAREMDNRGVGACCEKSC